MVLAKQDKRRGKDWGFPSLRLTQFITLPVEAALSVLMAISAMKGRIILFLYPFDRDRISRYKQPRLKHYMYIAIG